MKYLLNQKYSIRPYDKEKYLAECVGFITIFDAEKYPVFKFDFYKSPPTLCYMVLEKGKCLFHSNNVENLMKDFRNRSRFYGYEHNIINHWGHEIPKGDFVTQARNCNVSDGIVQESLKTGYFNGAKSSNGGDIKWCPTCKVIRITDCCACGCGSCSICRYRWTCREDLLPQVIDGTVVQSPILFGDGVVFDREWKRV